MQEGPVQAPEDSRASRELAEAEIRWRVAFFSRLNGGCRGRGLRGLMVDAHGGDGLDDRTGREKVFDREPERAICANRANCSTATTQRPPSSVWRRSAASPRHTRVIESHRHQLDTARGAAEQRHRAGGAIGRGELINPSRARFAPSAIVMAPAAPQSNRTW